MAGGLADGSPDVSVRAGGSDGDVRDTPRPGRSASGSGVLARAWKDVAPVVNHYRRLFELDSCSLVCWPALHSNSRDSSLSRSLRRSCASFRRPLLFSGPCLSRNSSSL